MTARNWANAVAVAVTLTAALPAQASDVLGQMGGSVDDLARLSAGLRERVAAFVASCGLALEEQRNFGDETPRARARAGFAVAVVPTAPDH